METRNESSLLPTISLGSKEIALAWNFSKKFITKRNKKSLLDFGHGKRARTQGARFVDCFTGKLGELVLIELGKYFGYSIEVDTKIIRGRLNIDNGQDISLINGVIPGISCDVKTSKSSAQWLLVESHKVDKEIIQPDVYIFFKINFPKGYESKPDSVLGRKLEAVCSGYVFYEDLFDSDGTPWFEYGQFQSPIPSRLAEKVVHEAIQNSGDIMLTKKSLTDSYHKLADSEREERINLKLKAKSNIGFPAELMRNRKDEFEFLLDQLVNSGDSQSKFKSIIQGWFQDLFKSKKKSSMSKNLISPCPIFSRIK